MTRGRTPAQIQDQEDLWNDLMTLKPDDEGVRVVLNPGEYDRTFGKAPGWFNNRMKAWAKANKIRFWQLGSPRYRRYQFRVNGMEIEHKTSADLGTRYDAKAEAAARPETIPADEEIPLGPIGLDAVSQSKKEQVLYLLRSEMVPNGNVNAGFDYLRRKVGLSEHDFIKYLFDLKEQGLIELKTHGRDKSLKVTAIRVRPAGTIPKALREPAPTTPPTDATGRVVMPQVQPEDDSLPPLPAEPGGAIIQQESTTEFPIISRLLKRRSKILEASKLLEEAGLDDEALGALSKADELTGLEAEILKLVEEKGLSDSFRTEAGPQD